MANKLRHSRAQMQLRIDKLRKQVAGLQQQRTEREAALLREIARLTQRTGELAGEIDRLRQEANLAKR